MSRSRLKIRAARHGFTLIETAIVVALTSVVFTLATATLVTLFRLERQFAGDAAQGLAMMRLASHWRADAHRATEAKLDGGCELTLADGRVVRYTFTSPAIIREVRRGEQLEHRDGFVLPRRAVVEFSIEPASKKKIVRVNILSTKIADRAYATPVRPLSIAAAVDLYSQVSLMEDMP